jgi:hypothetical protein
MLFKSFQTVHKEPVLHFQLEEKLYMYTALKKEWEEQKLHKDGH